MRAAPLSEATPMHPRPVSTPRRQLLSIVVPCFNEEEVIGETVRRLRAFCDTLVDLDVEVLFIDDGSRDRTRELLRGYAAEDARVRVLGFARTTPTCRTRPRSSTK